MKYRQTGRQMPQKTTFSNGSDKQNAGGGQGSPWMICMALRIFMMKNSKILGIKNRITTFVARHTWATILMQNNISIAYISKGLGHTSLLTTEKYLADFDQDKKREVGALISGLGTQHK